MSVIEITFYSTLGSNIFRTRTDWILHKMLSELRIFISWKIDGYNVLSIIVFPVKLALITTQTEPELLNFKPIAKFIGISTNSAKRWVEFWDNLVIKLSVANLKCDR